MMATKTATGCDGMNIIIGKKKDGHRHFNSAGIPTSTKRQAFQDVTNNKAIRSRNDKNTISKHANGITRRSMSTGRRVVAQTNKTGDTDCASHNPKKPSRRQNQHRSTETPGVTGLRSCVSKSEYVDVPHDATSEKLKHTGTKEGGNNKGEDIDEIDLLQLMTEIDVGLDNLIGKYNTTLDQSHGERPRTGEHSPDPLASKNSSSQVAGCHQRTDLNREEPNKKQEKQLKHLKEKHQLEIRRLQETIGNLSTENSFLMQEIQMLKTILATTVEECQQTREQNELGSQIMIQSSKTNNTNRWRRRIAGFKILVFSIAVEAVAGVWARIIKLSCVLPSVLRGT